MHRRRWQTMEVMGGSLRCPRFLHLLVDENNKVKGSKKLTELLVSEKPHVEVLKWSRRLTPTIIEWLWRHKSQWQMYWKCGEWTVSMNHIHKDILIRGQKEELPHTTVATAAQMYHVYSAASIKKSHWHCLKFVTIISYQLCKYWTYFDVKRHTYSQWRYLISLKNICWKGFHEKIKPNERRCPVLWFVWKKAQEWKSETVPWSRSKIWIQEECRDNILLFSVAAIIHSWIAARKETWKPFLLPSTLFSSAKASHASSRLPSLIFSLCFSPRVPIQSIFISPSVPFTAAFISTRSLNLRRPLFRNPSQSFHQLSGKLWLTFSTCLSYFSNFFQEPKVYFSSDFQDFFPLSTSIFLLLLSVVLSTHSRPLHQKYCLTEALCGPINLFSLMSFPTDAFGSTGQVNWFKGRRRQTDETDLIV